MGEVGETLFHLLEERNIDSIGIDVDSSKCKNYSKNDHIKNPEYLHVCLPGELSEFMDITLNWINKIEGLKVVLVHSTVKPGTTKKIQEKSKIPVLFSPIRGVHKRFLDDIKKYTKFISSDKENIDPKIKLDLEKRFEKNRLDVNNKNCRIGKNISRHYLLRMVDQLCTNNKNDL